MVKVKVVNNDNTDSTYNVTYPKAYVQKIIDEENLRDGVHRVKEIYVNDSIVAKLLVSCGKYSLAHHSDQSSVKTNHKKDYWVTDHTCGNVEITYK
jgi:hypothetical protein|tara:strand:+ start:183 stop:470 length:288 start_codon:yes stop_codon:yes gene_type:complete